MSITSEISKKFGNLQFKAIYHVCGNDVFVNNQIVLNSDDGSVTFNLPDGILTEKGLREFADKMYEERIICEVKAMNNIE